MKTAKGLEIHALRGTTCKQSGEGGIRTLERVSPLTVFETLQSATICPEITAIREHRTFRLHAGLHSAPGNGPI